MSEKEKKNIIFSGDLSKMSLDELSFKRKLLWNKLIRKTDENKRVEK